MSVKPKKKKKSVKLSKTQKRLVDNLYSLGTEYMIKPEVREAYLKDRIGCEYSTEIRREVSSEGQPQTLPKETWSKDYLNTVSARLLMNVSDAVTQGIMTSDHARLVLGFPPSPKLSPVQKFVESLKRHAAKLWAFLWH